MTRLAGMLLALSLAAPLAAACARRSAPTSPPPAATDAPPAEAVPVDYRDPALPIETRVEALLAQMTLAEKIGQMTLVEKDSIAPDDIAAKSIGGLLSGGGGYPHPNTPEGWVEMVNGFQRKALETRLGIPLLYGADAVHGHGNLRGATVFPHNVGLGATRDPALVERIGRATAEQMAATGVYWNFAPVVAIPQDIRWGRTYEGYGQATPLVVELGVAYLRGLQAGRPGSPWVMGTPKHFVGDGGTRWGSSTTGGYRIDQGVTDVDDATLRAVHLPPYRAALDAGALSVMASFSSWGGMKMHAQRYLLTDVLKGELGFDGFVVSDWQAIDQLPGDYYSDVVTSVNAGVDMNMVPSAYDMFLSTLTSAVQNGDVPMARIDDAVRRILRAKFALGLFEHPFADESLLATVGSDEHRALARAAVAKSLVLLKNENRALPIAKETPLVFVAGEAADDLGIQSGGWTIEWQGRRGDLAGGTTILQGIERAVAPGTTVRYNRFGKYDRVLDASGNPAIADMGIVVVGETPYAEGVGDRDDLTLPELDVNLIARVRERVKRLVVVLISGRPLIITDQLPLADAFVAAWLPGTEGQGVADVLFGDVPPTGRLPYTWPRSMDQLPFDFAHLPTSGCDAPLFPFGYGLDAAEAAHLVLPECP